MKWLNAFIAVLTRRTNSGDPAHTAPLQPTSAGGSGSASFTSRKPTPSVTQHLAPSEAIRARAAQERRNRKQRAAYIAQNLKLIPIKGH